MPKQSKKSINRHSKNDLLKFALDNGIGVRKSHSKRSIVEAIFKNKSVRDTLPLKAKRIMSAKQKANLNRFRFKKSTTKEQDDSAVVSKPIPVAAPSKPNPKSSVKIDPTASNKVEPVPASIKQNPSNTNKGKAIAEATPQEKMKPKASVDKFLKGKELITDIDTGEVKGGKVKGLLTKIDKQTRDKASFHAERLHQQLGGTNADAKRMRAVDSHTQRLLNRTSINKGLIVVKKKGYRSSTSKSSDDFDRNVLNRHSKRNKKIIAQAVRRAKGQQDKTFDGQLDSLGEPTPLQSGASQLDKVNRLLLLQAQLDAGLITPEQFKQKLAEIQGKDEFSVGRDKLQSQLDRKEITKEKFVKQVGEL